MLLSQWIHFGHSSNFLCMFFGQVFFLHPPIHTSEGEELGVSFAMTRSKENHRLMEVDLACQIRRSSGTQLSAFENKFYIE